MNNLLSFCFFLSLFIESFIYLFICIHLIIHLFLHLFILFLCVLSYPSFLSVPFILISLSPTFPSIHPLPARYATITCPQPLPHSIPFDKYDERNSLIFI